MRNFFFDDKNGKKMFGSQVFIIFFSTFEKKLVPPKGSFGQKTHEILMLKTHSQIDLKFPSVKLPGL